MTLDDDTALVGDLDALAPEVDVWPSPDTPAEAARRWVAARDAALAPGVTVVIPSIPTRGPQLARAVASVLAQTLPASAISVALDVDHEGAGPTRTRALRAVRTRWTAFLDDDDELYPHHLDALWTLHQATKADVLVPWFDVVGGADPFPQHRGRLFNDPAKAPEDHRIFPITYMARTAYLQACRFPAPRIGAPDWAGDDYPVIVRMHELGARFAELPAEAPTTWAWHHWGYGQQGRPGNTSGDPARW